MQDENSRSGMLKIKKIGEGLAIEFNPLFSIVEGHLFVYAFPEGMLDAFIEVMHMTIPFYVINIFLFLLGFYLIISSLIHIKNYNRDIIEDKKDLIRRVTTPDEVDFAISRGLIPIVIPHEISDHFSSILPLQSDNPNFA